MKNSKTIGISVIAALAIITGKSAMAQGDAVISITPNNGAMVGSPVSITSTGMITNNEPIGVLNYSCSTSVAGTLFGVPSYTTVNTVTVPANMTAFYTQSTPPEPLPFGYNYTDTGTITDPIFSPLPLTSNFNVGGINHLPVGGLG